MLVVSLSFVPLNWCSKHSDLCFSWKIQQAGIKSRPGFTVAQYTREWTTVVQEFVRKQLAEIALPEAASSFINSVSSRGTGKGVLVDGELRASWTTRFGYRCASPSPLLF